MSVLLFPTIERFSHRFERAHLCSPNVAVERRGKINLFLVTEWLITFRFNANEPFVCFYDDIQPRMKSAPPAEANLLFQYYREGRSGLQQLARQKKQS